ncbi:MAG: hypothetical protein ACYDH6_16090 [Acidimicrobiales bacterium]
MIVTEERLAAIESKVRRLAHNPRACAQEVAEMVRCWTEVEADSEAAGRLWPCCDDDG